MFVRRLRATIEIWRVTVTHVVEMWKDGKMGGRAKEAGVPSSPFCLGPLTVERTEQKRKKKEIARLDFEERRTKDVVMNKDHD